MTEKLGLSWLDNKKEKYHGAPHMRLESEDGTWKSRVIKTWQPGNEGREGARWMMGIESPHTGGGEDLGDTWIPDVILATPLLIEVNGEEATLDQRMEWAMFAYQLGVIEGERWKKEAENA